MNKPKLGVEFHGDGPFDLPAAQAVSAQSHGDSLAVSFRILVSPNEAATVHIAMTNNRAQELAGAISKALGRPA
jgi:hypothetical protein